MSVTYIFQIDLDRDGDWTDVADTLSSSVVSAEWFLGMDEPYGLVAAPSWAEVVLDNSTKAFSPEVGGGLMPGLPARIQSNDGTTTRTHFTGFVQWVQPTAGIVPQRTALVRLGGYDAEIADNTVLIDLQVSQTADALLDLVLKRCKVLYSILSGYMIIGVTGYDLLDTGKLFGYPVTLSSETGESTFAYVGDTWREGIRADVAIKQIVEAERGRFFWSRAGVPTFYNRLHTLTDVTDDATINSNIQGIEYAYAELLSTVSRVRIVPRSVGAAGSVLWSSTLTYRVEAGASRFITARFRDSDQRAIGAYETITLVPGTDWTANSRADGTGTNVTASMDIYFVTNDDGSAALVEMRNHSNATVFISGLQVRGTPLNQGDPVTVEFVANEQHTFYGRRLYELDIPLLSTIDEAEQVARYELGRRRWALGRISSVQLSAAVQQSNVLTRTLFDRVVLADTQIGHSRSYFIVSERHQVSCTAHVVTWGVELADSEIFFIIGSSTLDSIDPLAY